MIRQATTCNGGSLEKRFLTSHVEGAVGDVRTLEDKTAWMMLCVRVCLM